MKSLYVFLGLLASAGLAVSAGAVDHLSLADATPGRTGVCITEMDGGERVEIPLTVLGTVGSGTPDGEIVLVRLDDPRFEHTGIIAGMSGSPVYLDGRLLGALAFGWPFAKEPIGGVTPFERMLKVEPSPPTTAANGRPPFAEIMAAVRNGTLGKMVVDWLQPETGNTLHPLPMVVGGPWVPSGSGWLAESWRRMGWVGTPGGTSKVRGDPREIAPGDMVAAVLVDGDATISAAGTVTEVRGDLLWAFGHPSLGAGATIIPLARANVVAVMPSVMSSFKFFTVGEPIGALVADRAPGIMGRLGQEAPMVPVRVVVDGHAYSYRVVRHSTLLPLLAGYLSHASQGAFGRTFGNQTLSTSVEVRYPGEQAARASAVFAGVQAPAEAAAFATAVVGYFEGSGFTAPAIGSVDITLDTDETIRTAEIVEIVPAARVVRPGEELEVRFRMQRYRGGEEIRTVTLHIPDGTPDGRLDLVGADGAAWTVYDLKMRPFETSSFADEVRLVNGLVPGNILVAALERRDLGMVVSGGSLSAPPSLVLQLRSALGPNLETTAYSVFAEAEVEVPYRVTGAQRIPITVRSRD